MKPISKGKEIKETAKVWCEDTSFHAFLNIVKNPYWILKLVWTLAFNLSLGYCIFYIWQCLMQFFGYPVQVNLSSVLESPANFPAITICNLYAFDAGSTSTKKAYFANALNESNLSFLTRLDDNQVAYECINNISTILKAYITSDQSINTTFKQSLGLTMDDMLVSCYFNGVSCNSSDFTYFRTNDYGNCYTFNGQVDAVRQVSRTGTDSGLTMELYVGKPSVQDLYSMKRGIYVAIHNQTNIPLVKDEGFVIKTGTSASVAIKRIFYSKLDSPYSSCRKDIETILDDDSNFFKYTKSVNKYSRKLCYEICFQYLYAIPACNCSDPSVMIVDSDQVICKSAYDLGCITSQRNIFDNLPISDYCDVYCPLECDSIEYDVSIVTAKYPSDYYNNILSQQSTVVSKNSVTISSSSSGSSGKSSSSASSSASTAKSVTSNSTMTQSSTTTTTKSVISTVTISNSVSGIESLISLSSSTFTSTAFSSSKLATAGITSKFTQSSSASQATSTSTTITVSSSLTPSSSTSSSSQTSTFTATTSSESSSSAASKTTSKSTVSTVLTTSSILTSSDSSTLTTSTSTQSSTNLITSDSTSSTTTTTVSSTVTTSTSSASSSSPASTSISTNQISSKTTTTILTWTSNVTESASSSSTTQTSTSAYSSTTLQLAQTTTIIDVTTTLSSTTQTSSTTTISTTTTSKTTTIITSTSKSISTSSQIGISSKSSAGPNSPAMGLQYVESAKVMAAPMGPMSSSTSSNAGSSATKTSTAAQGSTSSSSSSSSSSTASLEDSMVQMNFYYESLRYTSVEEEAVMSAGALIGLIGGIFGLCLGSSWLSFVEIFELLVKLVLIIFNTKRTSPDFNTQSTK